MAVPCRCDSVGFVFGDGVLLYLPVSATDWPLPKAVRKAGIACFVGLATLPLVVWPVFILICTPSKCTSSKPSQDQWTAATLHVLTLLLRLEVDWEIKVTCYSLYLLGPELGRLRPDRVECGAGLADPQAEWSVDSGTHQTT